MGLPTLHASMLLPFLTLVPLLPLLFCAFPPSSHAFSSVWASDISFFYPKDMGFHSPFHSGGFPYYNRFLRARRGSEDGGQSQGQGQGQTSRVEAFRRMYRGEKPNYVNNYAQAVMRGLG